MELGNGFGVLAGRRGGRGFKEKGSDAVVFSRQLRQPLSRGHPPTEVHEKLAQAFQLGYEDPVTSESLPRRRQIEEENPGGDPLGNGVKPAAELVAVGREDYGGAGLILRKVDDRVGEGTNPFRGRETSQAEVRGGPNPARLQAVGLDPFRRHPRAGEEDLHQVERPSEP